MSVDKKNRGGIIMAEARCMKCKKQIEVKEPQDVVMKNGMKAISGLCPYCSTKVFKIIGKNKS
jgi:DNA-directed RNA polymerase subunit RPC12/RpoP